MEIVTGQMPKSYMELVATKLVLIKHMPIITESSTEPTLDSTMNGVIFSLVVSTPSSPSADAIFSTLLTTVFQVATPTFPLPFPQFTFLFTTFHHLMWNLLDFFSASLSSTAQSSAVASPTSDGL